MPAANDIYRLHQVRLSPAGAPLHDALAAAVPGLSRQQARRALRAGLVTIGGAAIADPLHGTVPSDGVGAELDLRQGIRAVWVKVRHGEPLKPVELGILHLDGDLCVVDKPSGVPTVPPPNTPRARGHVGDLLRVQLRRRGHGSDYIGIVHRLDLDTSGCLVVALTRGAHRILAAQFAGEAAARTYRCLVAGQPPKDADTITAKQGRGSDGRRALVEADQPGVEAVTSYSVLRRFAGGAELEVGLGTGRTHQVRVALASIGCPVLGDRVYARNRGDAHAPRLMLHAARIELDHPRDGRRLRIESPVPALFAETAQWLAEAPPPARRPGPRTR